MVASLSQSIVDTWANHRLIWGWSKEITVYDALVRH